MEKPLQIAFKNTQTSTALESLIRKWVDRLERLNKTIMGYRISSWPLLARLIGS